LPPRSRPLAAAALLAGAAGCFLATEAVVAAAFPGYSYTHHVISDLGTAASPDAVAMNASFAVSGLLVAAATALAAGGQRAIQGAALAHAAGMVVIALAPSDTGPLHVAGPSPAPVAVWERAAVYPIQVAELLLAGWLISRRRSVT
jgi:hypothetical membrane protein